MIESLETRSLYSVASVSVVGNTLLVLGTPGPDGVVVQQFDDAEGNRTTQVDLFDLANPTETGLPNETLIFEGDINNVLALLGDGNDIFDGTNNFSNHYIDCGKGDDLVVLSNGNDVILGGDGNDTLYGQGGNDIILGGNGDDELSGGEGRNIVLGGRGINVIVD